MKKSLIKNLLDRRMPQIIGSYFVGSTTLILFIDWLITKYGFADNILQFTWFGLISILPSVLIVAYSQEINYFSTENWLEREKKVIDSLETNFQTIIDGGVWGLEHGDFRYYLRILNIQDSIATAKITGSIFPFAKPKIGDKINIK